MTPTQVARFEEAKSRERADPKGRHVEFQYRDDDKFQSCLRCGLIMPRKGWPDGSVCRGIVRVVLREARVERKP